MKKILLLLPSVILIGCVHKNPVSPTGGFVSIAPAEEPNTAVLKPGSISPKPFFDFDEIIHTRIIISDSACDALYDHRIGSPERNLVYFLSTNQPLQITDSAIAESIKHIEHRTLRVHSKFFQQLNDSVFSERNCTTSPPALACQPIYRDILVFKKDKKTVGIAKICFQCKMFHLTGAKNNTHNFGQYEDFKLLSAVLKKNEALYSAGN